MNRVVFENQNTSFLKLAYPHASLQRVVEYYFEVDSKGEETILGLPSANSVLAFQLDRKGKSFNGKTGQWISLPRVALLGNTSMSFTGHYPASSTFFYIKLKPVARGLLFNFPGGELLNNHVDVEKVLKDFCFSRFQDQASFQYRVALVEDYLTRNIDMATVTYRQRHVELLFNQFAGSSYVERVNIEALCSRLNVTYASMRRYCLDELGVSPKFYQKAQRFKTALGAYKQNARNFNADDFGYNDFSHFCKDARQLTGRGPGAL